MSHRMPNFINILEEKDPAMHKAVAQVFELALRPGALDAKTKLLISLALDAVIGATEGVAVLSQRAREVGITEEEIAEALRLSYVVAGNNVLCAAAAAYKK